MWKCVSLVLTGFNKLYFCKKYSNKSSQILFLKIFWISGYFLLYSLYCKQFKGSQTSEGGGAHNPPYKYAPALHTVHSRAQYWTNKPKFGLYLPTLNYTIICSRIYYWRAMKPNILLWSYCKIYFKVLESFLNLWANFASFFYLNW